MDHQMVHPAEVMRDLNSLIRWVVPRVHGTTDPHLMDDLMAHHPEVISPICISMDLIHGSIMGHRLQDIP